MNPIDNYQANQLTRLDWHNAAEDRDAYGHRFAEFLGGPSPLYNCHGLTFAARRTQVSGESDIVHWILEEDGYEPLPKGVPPRISDIVIYYDVNGLVEHSGVVVGMTGSVGLEPTPRVWSKWGKGHEVVHSLYDCPYNPSVRYYRMKSWPKPQ